MMKISKKFKIGDYNGDNPTEAAYYGDYPKLVSLIQNGQAINQTSKYNRTSLMLASVMPWTGLHPVVKSKVDDY